MKTTNERKTSKYPTDLQESHWTMKRHKSHLPKTPDIYYFLTHTKFFDKAIIKHHNIDITVAFLFYKT